MVLGWDVAGTVDAAGPGVSGLTVGTPVAAMSFQPIDQNGTYADLVLLDADLVVKVPDGLPLVQASTVPLAGLTATQLLDLLARPAGATIVVDGALGAVGGFVVQLARRRGLQVIAVVREDGVAAALSLGAAEAITVDELPERAGTADGAIDLVGGTLAHQVFGAVRDGGAYVTSVPPYIDPSGPFDPARDITPAVLTVAPEPEQLRNLLQLAADNLLATPIDRSFPLDEAGAAHAHVASGHLHGKVVLIP
jgi:NADPH2:quinone reductase